VLVPLRRGLPLGGQIYLFFREGILGGRLRPGERLPASRALARQLGIARNTVVAAYARLAAEGYVEGFRAAGTRVSEKLPATRQGRVAPTAEGPSGRARGRKARTASHLRRVTRWPDVYPPAARRSTPLTWDFQYNVNVADPAARRVWHRLLRRRSAAAEREPAPYDLTRRPGPLNEAIARYLALARGVCCRGEQVLLLHGAQQAFQLAARLLAEPGESVLVEDPTYLGARNAFLSNGLRVVPVAADANGMQVERLPRDPRVRFAFVSPSHLWPTGAVLPLDRRLRLLEWAQRNGAWILEHDHNSEYGNWRTPVVSLQGLDQGRRVLYVGTFTRLISPDPGVAYVVVPEPLVQPFSFARELAAYYCGALESDVLARFLDAGEMEGLLRRLERKLRPLRECLFEALDGVPGGSLVASRTSSGLHVHTRVTGIPGSAADELTARCAAAGVGVFPDTPYYLRTPRTAGLVLGFARMTPGEIRAGVSRLAQVIEEVRASPA
jgi:GntR family transcriptional regulator/MocR family aminotransferase